MVSDATWCLRHLTCLIGFGHLRCPRGLNRLLRHLGCLRPLKRLRCLRYLETKSYPLGITAIGWGFCSIYMYLHPVPVYKHAYCPGILITVTWLLTCNIKKVIGSKADISFLFRIWMSWPFQTCAHRYQIPLLCHGKPDYQTNREHHIISLCTCLTLNSYCSQEGCPRPSIPGLSLRRGML